MWSTDGFVHPAIGARGGHPGAPARQYLRRADGEVEPLPGWGELKLAPGDTVLASSAAGAGYGPPWERALERVRADVREGWVGGEQATGAYGVIFAGAAIDAEATAARRAELAAAAAPPPAALEVEAAVAAIAASLAAYVRPPESEARA